MGKYSNKKTKFDTKWLDEEKYKSWLEPDQSSVNSFYCNKCKKTNQLSNMGHRALDDHNKGEKHQEKLKELKVGEKIQDHFKPTESNTAKDSSSPIKDANTNLSKKLNKKALFISQF